MNRDQTQLNTSARITAMRLPLGVCLAWAVWTKSDWALALLVAFVGWDIIDGAIARRLNQETPYRRALDGSIDRIVACTCLIVGTIAYDGIAAIPIAIVVLREILLSVRNYRLARNGIVFSGVGVHKLSSILQAALGATIVATPGEYVELLAWVTAIACTALGCVYAAAQSRAPRVCGQGIPVAPFVVVRTTTLTANVELMKSHPSYSARVTDLVPQVAAQ